MRCCLSIDGIASPEFIWLDYIACIEDPVIIKKILTYLEEKLPTQAALLLPDSRAPPQSSLFG